jgi:hypothetical protein
MSQFVGGAITRASGEALVRYRLVKLDNSNTWVYADAGDVPIGYTTTAATTSGDRVAVQPLTKDGTIPATAGGAIQVGDKCYTGADGKVLATRDGAYVGVFMGSSAAASGDIIEVCCTPNSDLSYASVAASTALTNTTTETSFGKTFTIPANQLQVGSVIKYRTQGIATATNSTDTLTIKVYVGGVEVASTGAVDVANNDIWVIDGEVTIRTVGASGTFVGNDIHILDAAGTGAVSGYKASTAIDTTAAVSVDVKGTWSVANAGNSCRLDSLTASVVA